MPTGRSLPSPHPPPHGPPGEPPMRIRSTGSALAAVAALAVSAWIPAATATAADGGAAARPGDIVSSTPSAFHPLPGQPTGTRAWKVHYRSTTADGAPNVVSGTVIVPQ